MQCPTCATINPAQARFCMGCGQLLVQGAVCGHCNTLLPPQARYCYHCGAYLAQPAPAAANTVYVTSPAVGFAPATPPTVQPVAAPPPSIAPAAPAAPPESRPAAPIAKMPTPPTPPVAAVAAPPPEAPQPPPLLLELPEPRALELLLPALERYLPAKFYEPLERRPKENDLRAAQEHLKALLDTVKTYLPRPVVAAAQPTGEPAGGMYQGVFLFGDVSGFTPLSERLKAQGQAGAERITEIINSLFSQLVEVLFAHGGSLLKFGGDALLGLFPAETEAELQANVLRAAQTGLAMQAVLAREEFAAIDAMGEIRALKIKCGISAGPYFAAHIGTKPRPEQNIRGTMAYITTGRTVNQAEESEGHANPGEVVMPIATYNLIKGQIEVGPVTKSPDDDFTLIHNAPPFADSVAPYALVEPPAGELLAQITYLVDRLDRLTPYLSDELIFRIATNPTAKIAPQNRPAVTVMFVNYVGISELIEDLGHSHPEIIVERLNSYFARMAQIVEKYEGLLARMDQYAIGDRLVIFFGAPHAHEDDPVRAVYTALEMQEATRKFFSALQTPAGIYRFRQRIGINTGSLFAGNVGAADLRQEYTLMGDDINMAARLMSYAKWDSIYVSNKTAEHIKAYVDMSEIFELKVKGKEILIPTREVLGRKGEVGRTRGFEEGDAHYIGRQTELAQVQQCATKFLTGRGQILSIIGNSGLGKSRLARELKAWLYKQPNTANVLWIEARALSFSEQMSYWMAHQVIQALLELPPNANEDDTLFALWEKGGALLGKEKAREIVPFLANLLGLSLEGDWATEVRELSPKVRQKETFWAARQFLSTAAKANPIIIVLDDLHWADDASLVLFQDLLNVTDHAQVMFCLIFRERRDKGCWQLRDLAAADYLHRYTEIQLQPLNPEDSRRLLQSLLPGAEFAEEILQEIFDKSAGNPFYLEEVVRSLMDTGAVIRVEPERDYLGELLQWAKPTISSKEKQKATWRVDTTIKQISVPNNLQAAIVSRIDRLTEDARQALQLVSVLGRQFRLNILRTVAQAEEEVDIWLSQLERSGLIRPAEITLDTTYAFPDALVQEIAYDSMLVQTRQQLHYKIAKALEEKIFAENPEQGCELLAYHFSRSDDQASAIKYLELAAKKARNEYANETAIQHYTQLLEIKHARNDQAGQAGALYNLGVIAYELGDFDRARPWLEEATTLYRAVQDQGNEGWSVMYLGMVDLKQADYDAATQQHTRALELARARADSFQEGIHLTNLARVTLRMGDYDRALAQFQESLEMKRKNNDLTGQAFAHYYLGLVHIYRGDYAAAEAALHESVALWEQAPNNARGLSYCEQGWGLLALARSAYAEAEAHFQRGYEISEKLALKAEMIENLSQLSQAQVGLGKLEEAVQSSTEAITQLRKQKDVEEGQLIYLNHYRVLNAQGELQAEKQLLKARDMMMEQAQRIHDEAQRRIFLEHAHTNRAIQAALQPTQ